MSTWWPGGGPAAAVVVPAQSTPPAAERAVLWPLGLPCWYGKLPGMGDFAQRRLPPAFVGAWDGWLQQGMLGLRGRHPDWTLRYLDGALWFFVLAAPPAGPHDWIGVMMPSVDGVGRYFPFTIATALPVPASELRGSLLSQARRWWALAARAALQGLHEDLDAAGFEDLLATIEATVAEQAASDAPPPLVPPAPGDSLWLTDPSGAPCTRLCVRGLPRDAAFDMLFGSAPDPAAG